MGVYVKGMKMPKNCGSCWLSRMRGSSLGGILDCKIFGTVGTAMDDPYDILNKRHPDCPLIELPEKHGRLIDETIVLEMIRKSLGIKDLSFLYNAEKSVVNEIFHAPTVIEAEGDEG